MFQFWWAWSFVCGVKQARSQVSRFGGAQYIFRGEQFLLLL